MAAAAERAKTVFLRAVETASAEERRAYLDDACRGDTALRREVEELLAHHGRLGAFMESPPGAKEWAPLHTEAEAPTERAAPPDDDLSFLAPTDRPGALGRLGHYEVQEVVGRGGMGVVFKAFDERLHRVVAVKVLAPQLAAGVLARKRFTREAQAAAAVSHEHVVAIHAVEENDGLPFLVMQYVAGVSLQQRLERGGRLEVKEVLRIGMQTAAGLAAAHAQGLIHRDIKPANIMLENGVERVKITDFGLARAVGEAGLTLSGLVAGTPHYMSPEQAEGKLVDPRSDLFSLGGVLYALCTGAAPFRADHPLAVLKRVCEETPRPVRQSNPDVPDWLAAVIAKLLAKEPADRFQTAQELADLLGRHLAQLQQPAAAPSPGRKPAVSARAPVHRGRRRAIAGAVLFVLVCGVALAVAAWRGVFAPGGNGVATSPSPPPGPTAPAGDGADRDRAAAEWALELGGSIAINEPRIQIAQRGNLPQQPFQLVSIDVQQKQVTDISLGRLEGLTRLEELYLGWNQITDVGLAHLHDMTSLRTLSLQYTGVSSAGLAHLRGLTELQCLDLTGTGVTDAGLEHLRFLKGLQQLTLFETHVSGSGLEHLRGLTGLTNLRLGGTDISEAGLEHLRGLTGLTLLDLCGARVSNTGLKHLKSLTGLQSLNLQGTGVSDPGLEKLQHLTALRTLRLDGKQITDAGLEYLRGLTQLRELYLGGTGVSDVGLKHLRDMTELGTLELNRTDISGAGLTELRGLAGLQQLSLSGARINDAGLEHLSGLTGLRVLFLGETPISDAGLEHLRGLTGLAELDLNGTNVSDAGLGQLSGLTGLQVLVLDATTVSDVGLEHLRGLTGLQQLKLNGTNVSEAGARKLKEALPKCTIWLNGQAVDLPPASQG